MKIILLRKSAVPLSTQLYEQIKANITSGALLGGQMLPSIRALAREMEISVITVKVAYERLEREGLLVSKQGKGCFVSESEEQKAIAKENALKRASEAVEFCRDSGVSEQEIFEMIKTAYKK